MNSIQISFSVNTDNDSEVTQIYNAIQELVQDPVRTAKCCLMLLEHIDQLAVGRSIPLSSVVCSDALICLTWFLLRKVMMDTKETAKSELQMKDIVTICTKVLKKFVHMTK